MKTFLSQTKLYPFPINFFNRFEDRYWSKLYMEPKFVTHREWNQLLLQIQIRKS